MWNINYMWLYQWVNAKKDVTPFLTHWYYIFLALTHRCKLKSGNYAMDNTYEVKKIHKNCAEIILSITWQSFHTWLDRFKHPIKKTAKFQWWEFMFICNGYEWATPSHSLNTKFEGSIWKIENAKNAKVTWSAIMHIFNEIWCSYSIPSKILTQMTCIPNIIIIHRKQLKLSFGHQTLMTKHPGSLRKA